VLLLGRRAAGQTTTWTDGVGDWFDPNNWSAGVPNSSTTAEIDNGGDAQVASASNALAGELTLGKNAGDVGLVSLSAGTLSIDTYIIGNSGAGTFAQTGGSNTCGAFFVLGYQQSGNGTYLLSGGTLSNSFPSGEDHIGLLGTGTFIQTGGINLFSYEFCVAYGEGGAAVKGTYVLSGGTLANTLALSLYDRGCEQIAEGGASTGSFIQTGGFNSVEILQVEPNGYYSLSGGTLSVAGYANGAEAIIGAFVQTGGTNNLPGCANSPSYGQGDLEVGGSNSPGSYNMSGGTISLAPSPSPRSNVPTCGLLCVDSGAGSTASFTLSGGLITGANVTEYIGYNNAGSFTQSGGTNTVPPYWLGGNVYLGYNPGSVGAYTLSGGTITVTGGGEFVGYSGVGLFAQSGGMNSTPRSAIYLGYNAGSTGTYTLSGGTLSTGGEYVGYQGAGSLNQTGEATNSGSYLDVGALGSFSISNASATFTNSTNNGVVDVQGPAGGLGAGSISLTGSYSQNNGVTTVDGFLSAPTIYVTGGTLAGGGVITGEVTNSGGAVVPEGAGRLLSVVGDFTQSGGTMDINLAGFNPGVDYDVLSITGTATLGGTLDVDWANGFIPQIGDQFTILTAPGGVGGAFANLTSDDPGFTYIVDYGANDNLVEITVDSVPEPGMLTLMALGSTTLLLRRRRQPAKVI
jgi:hypothetical protein